MAHNDIQRIIARIQADAKVKLDKITVEKSKQVDSINKDTAQKINVKKIKMAEIHNMEVTRIGKRMHSAARLDAKRMLLHAREEIIEEVFDRVNALLLAIPQGEYIAFLKEAIHIASNELGKDLIIHCRTQDTDAVKQSAGSGITLELREIARNTIGGIIIESKTSGAVMNNTFENIIHRERPRLREVIGRVLYPDTADVSGSVTDGAADVDN